MSYLSKLNELINTFKSNAKPKKLLIGYRLYVELMKERKFYEEVVGSSMNPNERKYRQLMIRITQDDFQLALV